jgi:mono/diheme cytochrome c family protein
VRRRRSALLAFAALLGAAGCDALPGRPGESERYVHPADVMAFETLYAENCSGCHGADGRLGPARPLGDPVYLALAGRDVLRRTIRSGVSGTMMPAFSQAEGGTLRDEQIDALVKGLEASWADAKALDGVRLPPYSETQSLAAGFAPGDPGRGRRVFGRFCGECHGMDGRGGPKGSSVVDSAFLGLVSDQMLRTATIAGRTDLAMPDWRGYVEGRSMDPQEISDVVAWMAAQRPRFPGQPYPEATAESGAGDAQTPP